MPNFRRMDDGIKICPLHVVLVSTFCPLSTLAARVYKLPRSKSGVGKWYIDGKVRHSLCLENSRGHQLGDDGAGPRRATVTELPGVVRDCMETEGLRLCRPMCGGGSAPPGTAPL